MSDDAYRAALRYRLLIPQFPVSHPCARKNCTQLMDNLGYHVLSCQGKCGGSYCNIYIPNQRRWLLLDIAISLVRGRAQVYSRDLLGIVQQADETAVGD